MFWRPPCMNPGERRLRHVWLKLQPTPIETYRNPADRLCVARIGSSDFISLILVSGGYCDFPRFVQILQSARLPCQLNSNPVCILFFSGGIHFQLELHSIYIIFLYILSKAQHHLYINMVYKWHDLRFIRLYPSIWIFKYLKPLYVEIQCMHSSLTVSN